MRFWNQNPITKKDVNKLQQAIDELQAALDSLNAKVEQMRRLPRYPVVKLRKES